MRAGDHVMLPNSSHLEFGAMAPNTNTHNTLPGLILDGDWLFLNLQDRFDHLNSYF